MRDGNATKGRKALPALARRVPGPGSAADADCLAYLEWLRWPDWLRLPALRARGGLADGRRSLQVRRLRTRTSPTAGTIFDRTRTPLTVWFTACWLFASQKDGISALSLQRQLEIGSYQTAWAMLHRLRSVLVRPGRERLAGEVEVDARAASAAMSRGCAAGASRARRCWWASPSSATQPNTITSETQNWAARTRRERDRASRQRSRALAARRRLHAQRSDCAGVKADPFAPREPRFAYLTRSYD